MLDPNRRSLNPQPFNFCNAGTRLKGIAECHVERARIAFGKVCEGTTIRYRVPGSPGVSCADPRGSVKCVKPPASRPELREAIGYHD